MREETYMNAASLSISTNAIAAAAAVLKAKVHNLNAALEVLEAAEASLLKNPSKETVAAIMPALDPLRFSGPADIDRLVAGAWSAVSLTLRSINVQEMDIADKARRQALADHAEAQREASDIAEATRIQRLLGKLPAAA